MHTPESPIERINGIITLSLSQHYLNAAKMSYAVMMREVDSFCSFSGFTTNPGGVYLLGDFYIGRTKEIRNRVVTHVLDAFGYPITPDSVNKRKCERLMDTMAIGLLPVIKLTDDQSMERELIRQYAKTHDLTNIQFLPRSTIK